MQAKKERGPGPAQNCVDPIVPDIRDLILIDGATLRAARQGLLPRLGPPDFNLSASLRIWMLDQLFSLVIIFGNDCSKFEQLPK